MMFFKKKKLATIEAKYKEHGPQVMVLVITKDYVEKRCIDSINAQDYPHYNTLIHIMKPESYHDDPNKNGVLNMVRNRNYLRKLALASEADHFLLVDSDIVLPKNAISSLMLHRKDFIGGWYRTLCGTNWTSSIIRDNVMHFFPNPQNSVVIAHSTGLGCVLVSRKLLERCEFREDIKREIGTNRGNRGDAVYLDDSSQFCIDAYSLGFTLYMNGDVICEHIIRQETETSYPKKTVIPMKKKGAKHG